MSFLSAVHGWCPCIGQCQLFSLLCLGTRCWWVGSLWTFAPFQSKKLCEFSFPLLLLNVCSSVVVLKHPRKLCTIHAVTSAIYLWKLIRNPKWLLMPKIGCTWIQRMRNADLMRLWVNTTQRTDVLELIPFLFSACRKWMGMNSFWRSVGHVQTVWLGWKRKEEMQQLIGSEADVWKAQHMLRNAKAQFLANVIVSCSLTSICELLDISVLFWLPTAGPCELEEGGHNVI